MNDFWLSMIVGLSAAIGAIVGHILKEIIPSMYLEKWKNKRLLKAVFRKYRDPIVLSATELVYRLEEIEKEYPPFFLKSSVRKFRPAVPTEVTADDKYYERYKFDSTIYRLCAFLGWFELYRKDVVFLRSGERDLDAQIETVMKRVRAALADGHLNTAKDWRNWRDALIFREEQRAIGESMLNMEKGECVVVGYGAFCALLELPQYSRWFNVADRFLVDPSNSKDFRRVRLRLLVWGLIDLIEFLESSRLSKRLQDARLSAQSYLSSLPSATSEEA